MNSNIIIGIIAVVLCALPFIGVESYPLHLSLKFPGFFLYLFREIVKANIDVAYRVLHPERPIKPGIVKIKTILKTDIAKVFLANSITLTPGTMTCEIDGDHLYIHWIWIQSPDLAEASKIIASRFETFLRRIFE